MMKKLIFSSVCLLLISSTQLSGQGFIKAVDNPWSQECYVTLNDGKELKCELRSTISVNASLRTINITDETGAKKKFKAEEIKRLRVKLSELAKIETLMEGTTSLQEMFEMDFYEIINREYVIYEQALLPKKKQTLLFSATFPEKVQALTQELLNDPVEIQLQSADASTLVQRVFTVNKGEKTALLAHLIKQHQWRQALIFVNAVLLEC